MSYTLIGICEIVDRKGRRVVKSTNKSVNTKFIGEAAVIYDNNNSQLTFTPIVALVNRPDLLKHLPGYKIEGRELVVDTNEANFKGNLDQVSNFTMNKRWSILEINNEAVKLINFRFEPQVISRENLNDLLKVGFVDNVWTTKSGRLDVTKYKQLIKPYQISPLNIRDTDEWLEQEIQENIETQGDEPKGEPKEQVELNDEPTEVREEPKEEPKKRVEAREEPKERIDTELERLDTIAYGHIIKNTQYGDIISIPSYLYNKYKYEIGSILNNSYDANGNVTSFKWLVQLQIDNTGNSLMGVVDGTATGDTIRLQVLSEYKRVHETEFNELKEIYRKHALELKYL